MDQCLERKNGGVDKNLQRASSGTSGTTTESRSLQYELMGVDGGSWTASNGSTSSDCRPRTLRLAASDKVSLMPIRSDSAKQRIPTIQSRPIWGGNYHLM